MGLHTRLRAHIHTHSLIRSGKKKRRKKKKKSFYPTHFPTFSMCFDPLALLPSEGVVFVKFDIINFAQEGEYKLTFPYFSSFFLPS